MSGKNFVDHELRMIDSEFSSGMPYLLFICPVPYGTTDVLANAGKLANPFNPPAKCDYLQVGPELNP